MDRRAIALICVIAGLVTGCAAAGDGAQASRNPARWAIYVPPGWHVVRFSESKSGVRSAGVQLSNVRLRAPVLLPGTPAEVNGEALPPRGVGVVISTATGRSPAHVTVAAPPLPLPWPDGHAYGWLLGSSPARSPIGEWLWFRIGGTLYVAAVTIGWKASRAAQQALGPIVRSIKPEPARP
jgi:hypothetical protein